MSTVQEFVRERRTRPWPTGWSTEGVPAKPLYDEYVAFAEARGERPLPMNGKHSFGTRLMELPGIAKDRISGGVLYYGIGIQTRAERARHEVMYGTGGPGGGGMHNDDFWPRLRAAQREHADRFHGGSYHACGHDTPPAVLDRLHAETSELVAARDASGEVDEHVEARYGAFLRWQDGDPMPHDPMCTIPPEEHDRITARMDAAYAGMGLTHRQFMDGIAGDDDDVPRLFVQSLSDQTDQW